MKYYKLRKKFPISVFCGSLIQQNHGESLYNHGYVIWNLKNKTFRQLDINNDYGFFTVDIKGGVLVTDISGLPKKTRLRVRCYESVVSEVKSVVSELRKKTEIVELTYIKVDSENSVINKTDATQGLCLSDLADVDYQNGLIKSFLESRVKNIAEPDIFFDKIYTINKTYNQLVDKDKIIRNIRWKPKKFEFNNMFSYGEKNVVDFSKMKDVIGLFATNTSGKSSLLSALSFCIFDKCDRAFKASHVLNSQKMSFGCKFNFEINNVDYFIERTGKSDKNGNVKVDVKFWKIENDKVVELNGEARRSTNDLIRDFVGSYDDFILTALSVQNNKSGTFVDMGQTERKDLLSQFMGLNIFDELYKMSSEKLKEISSELKVLYKSDSGTDLSKIDTSIFNATELLVKLTLEYDSMIKYRDSLNGEVLTNTKKIIRLDSNIQTDICSLDKSLLSTKQSLEKSISDRDTLSSTIESHRKELKSLQDKINSYGKIQEKYDSYVSLVKRATTLKHDVEKKKIFISSKLEKLARLENHKYDPDCSFCMDNEFVKDAILTKKTLGDDRAAVETLLNEYNLVNSDVLKSSGIESEYTDYTTLNKNMNRLDSYIVENTNGILRLNSKIRELELLVAKIVESITVYNHQKDSIELNKITESEIHSLNLKIKSSDNNIRNKHVDIVTVSTTISKLELEKQTVTDLRNRIKVLEVDQLAFQHYVLSTSRDGVPFELISKAVPIIEKEVNTILSQIVEFGINIHTDGKNIITNIVYDDKKWPLELASGLEKFVTSLVIRVALINISNLPRPNFIAVDEGFGCADADNLAAMQSLFSILKSNFDFMLIISHLDSMKDMVDSIIEVKKENGFSKITY